MSEGVKRGLAVALGVAIAAMLGYRMGFRRIEPEPTPAPRPQVAVAPTPAAPPVTKAPPAVTRRTGFRRATEQKPEGRNVIRFRVVRGQAVAFGDILLGTPDDAEITEGWYDAPTPQLWDAPEIPYAIHRDLKHPERIEAAIEYLHRHTPVRFVPFQGEPDAIVFEPTEEHCFSLLGRVGGHQPIRLSEGCGQQEILHEILHALGFIHEQSRPDRDSFVRVLWDNIEPKYVDQFERVPDDFMRATQGMPFDYHSIMLYRDNLFARNPGLKTLQSAGGQPIAPVDSGLSEGDIERIKRLFP